MLPEQKMAAKILARARLEPPFNLLALTEQYATVEYRSFPVEADGVTIGLGGAKKPHVLINSKKPKTRQQFTLAHEFGHVVIPWHTGIIASHIHDVGVGDFEYQEMEFEANRFASELLIPSAWIKNEFKWTKGFAPTFAKTLEASGTSRDAFLIKLFQTLDYPVYCVQVSTSGSVLKRYRCGGVRPYENLTSLKNLDDQFNGIPANREEFNSGDRSFVVWSFKPIDISQSDDRPWREILAQITDETCSKDKISSINAILPGQVMSNKGLSIEELSARIMLCYQGRPKIQAAVSHPLFKYYVIKRILELRSR